MLSKQQSLRAQIVYSDLEEPSLRRAQLEGVLLAASCAAIMTLSVVLVSLDNGRSWTELSSIFALMFTFVFSGFCAQSSPCPYVGWCI